ncbi:hypothetical protein [Streptomyces sp. NPDC097619]|uniref:hypothetical protein n=1 Tax=Streptomyces sp. NPDC097619 TaxID=3157228 RepID=UPI0033180EFE
MKKNKLAAGGAAAVIAAGIVLAGAQGATAAERVTSVAELHQHLALAVEQEQSLGAQGTLGDPIGREVQQSAEL